MVSTSFLADAKAAGVDGLIVRRSAAGGRRRIVPAGAESRASISSGSRRRRPTTSGCRRCSPTPRALSITCRSPALPAPPRRTPARSSAAVARIKRHTKLPVCVGFGVRTAEQARAIAQGADGVVVGSALVEAVRKSLGPDAKPTAATVESVTDLVRSLSDGVRGAQRGRPANPHGSVIGLRRAAIRA